MSRIKKINGNPVPELAEPGDPLVARDGQVVEEELDDPAETPFRLNNSQKSINPAYYKAETRRVLSDLSAPPKAMTGVGVVLFYTFLGIPDSEIADILGIDIHKLRTIRMSKPYEEVFEMINEELISANNVMIRNRIAKYSGNALDTVADIMINGKKENNKLVAAKDILDRASRKSDEDGVLNELRIRITRDDEDIEVNVRT